MAIQFASSINLTGNELQNAVVQNLATAPVSPSPGQVYFDTALDKFRVWDGSAWVDMGSAEIYAGTNIGISNGTINNLIAAGTGVTLTNGTIAADFGTISGKVAEGNDARFSDSRTPTGSAGGDLTGTYPNPTIANSAINNAKVASDAAIAESKLDLASDAAANVASRRTLGTGGTQACAGNDSRLSDARTPTGTAGGALTGSYPNPGIAAGTITNTEISATAAIALSKLATDPLDRANHTGTQAASTISDLATTVKAYRLDEFAAPTSALSAGSQRIANLAAGTATTDAVNLGQLQAAETGLDVKKSVKVATTGNVTIATALNGGDSIDSVSLSNGDRVLVRGQSDPIENGIYVVGDSPARASDADGAGELSGGAFVFVEQGDTYADTGWVVTTNGPITPGTDANEWGIFSRAGELVAGDGLSKTGATLAVDSTVARRNAANAFTVASTFAAATAGGTAVLESTTSSSGVGLRGVSDSGAGVEASSTSGPAFKVPSSHGGTVAFDANGEGIIKGIVDPVQAQDAASKAYVDGAVASYKADVGDNTNTSIEVTHNLGTKDIIVELYEKSSGETVLVETERTTNDKITLVFGTAPTTNQHRVLIKKV